MNCNPATPVNSVAAPQETPTRAAGEYALEQARRDGLKVAMYLRACGVPDAKLRGKSEACYVHDDDIVPDWTKNNAGLLYEANDDPHTDPATREAKIVNMFAEAGVAVEFVG